MCVGCCYFRFAHFIYVLLLLLFFCLLFYIVFSVGLVGLTNDGVVWRVQPAMRKRGKENKNGRKIVRGWSGVGLDIIYEGRREKPQPSRLIYIIRICAYGCSNIILVKLSHIYFLNNKSYFSSRFYIGTIYIIFAPVCVCMVKEIRIIHNK